MVVAGLVLAAAIGLIARQLISDRPPSRGDATPPSSRAAAVPPAAPVGLSCTGCPAVLRARVGHDPAGGRLVFGGSALRVLDLRTGRLRIDRRVRLPRGEQITDVRVLGASLAIFVQPTGLATGGRVYALGSSGPPLLLGPANFMLSGVGDTIWMATEAASSGPVTLAEVDATGHQLTRITLPGRDTVAAVTGAGLLVTVDTGNGGKGYGGARPQRLILVDPAGSSRLLSSTVDTVLAATDHLVAWSTPDGTVVLDDIDSGRQRHYRVGDAAPAGYGSFSTDGRRLALGYWGVPQINIGPRSYGYLQVLDLATGTTAPVGGVRIPPKVDAALGWTEPDMLVIGFNSGQAMRTAFWNAGTRHTTALSTAVSHAYIQATQAALLRPL